VEMIQ